MCIFQRPKDDKYTSIFLYNRYSPDIQRFSGLDMCATNRGRGRSLIEVATW